MDRALEQFVAVADAGSLTTAAETMNISQPALSYNLKRLEETLGVSLFRRSSRGVQLTPYGETLYSSAVFIGRLHSNALATIARQKSELEEGLSIGTGYSTWILLLKDYVIDHHATHPAAPINVSIGNMMRCMDQLIAGDISLFLGHRIHDLKPGLQADFLPIGTAVEGYFVRPGHPLLGQPREMDDIRAYPSTMANPADIRQQRLVSGASEHAMHWHGHTFTCNSMDACMEFTRNTDAVLIHSDILKPYFEERGLCQVTTTAGTEERRATMGIYVLPERRANPKVQHCIDAIFTYSREKALFLPL